MKHSQLVVSLVAHGIGFDTETNATTGPVSADKLQVLIDYEKRQLQQQFDELKASNDDLLNLISGWKKEPFLKNAILGQMNCVPPYIRQAAEQGAACIDKFDKQSKGQ